MTTTDSGTKAAYECATGIFAYIEELYNQYRFIIGETHVPGSRDFAMTCIHDIECWTESRCPECEAEVEEFGQYEFVNRVPSDDEILDYVRNVPLAIDVRSDWHPPGNPGEGAEYQITMATGGPAVRIVGDLWRGMPVNWTLEYQDWFTPWHPLYVENTDALEWFVGSFFYGGPY